MYGFIKQSGSASAQVVQVSATGYVTAIAFVQPDGSLGSWNSYDENDWKWEENQYKALVFHPDTHRPATVVNNLLEGIFYLRDIKGSSSDGYEGRVINANGDIVATAVNYMDGTGWVLFPPKPVVSAV